MTLLEHRQEALTDDRVSALLDVRRGDRPVSVKLTVNTRPSDWWQLRTDPIGSLELTAHMRAVATAEWQRRNGGRTIIVTAQDQLTGESVEVVQGQLIPPCPRCGYDRC